MSNLRKTFGAKNSPLPKIPAEKRGPTRDAGYGTVVEKAHRTDSQPPAEVSARVPDPTTPPKKT